MKQKLHLFLMVYAACGLVLSLVAHLLSLAGIQIQVGGTALLFALSVGIFPLWIPVVVISMCEIKTAKAWGDWNATLEIIFPRDPPWARLMIGAFWLNAMAYFILNEKVPPGHYETPPSAAWRLLSASWMLFYSAGLAIATSSYRRGTSNPVRRP